MRLLSGANHYESLQLVFEQKFVREVVFSPSALVHRSGTQPPSIGLREAVRTAKHWEKGGVINGRRTSGRTGGCSPCTRGRRKCSAPATCVAVLLYLLVAHRYTQPWRTRGGRGRQLCLSAGNFLQAPTCGGFRFQLATRRSAAVKQCP